MAGSNKSPQADDDHAIDEIFLDQLKDAFIFFTAVTVAAMDAIVLARKHYRKKHPERSATNG